LGWGSALSFYNHRYGGYYFLPDFTGITGGTYVEMAAQIRQTHISFALRGDAKGLRSEVREAGFVQTVQRQFINYSSALTIKKKIKNRYADRSTLLTLNASRTWRAPWLNELYSSGVHHGAASFEKGNINLSPEVCYRIEGIADVSHKKWQAFLSPYLAYLPGFINLAPMSSPVVTVRGVFPGFEYIQGDLIMCGFDAGLNIDLFKHLKWRGDINYIYQKYTNSKRYPAFIPPARIKQQLEFNNSRFSGSVSFDYTFKQNLYTNGTDYLPPPNAFALWGLRVFRKYLNTSFGLEVNNALNTTYRSYMDRFRYFMPMPGRNITFTFQHQIHHHTKKHSKTQ
jgi:iron complex outermembrane receptor protein